MHAIFARWLTGHRHLVLDGLNGGDTGRSDDLRLGMIQAKT
jgi:hypothetical protein